MRRSHILALPLLVLLTGCGGGVSDAAAAWSATIAFQADTKLGGCAVGDLDPTHPGNEIAAVALDGRVYVVRPTGEGFRTETVVTLPGEGVQCAIGDADPMRPGNELVVVGMASGTEDDGGPGAVHLVYRDETGWKSELMLEDRELVHGVGIGDLDPEHPGNEVVVTGFSRMTRMLAKRDGAWSVTAELPLLKGLGKNVLVIDDHALIANTSKGLSKFGVPGSVDLPEDTRRFLAIGAPQARLGRGEKQVVVACDDGSLRLTTADGPVIIHQEQEKLRGAVLGDLDPTVPGEEAATVGYEKKLTILYRGEDWRRPWTPFTLWQDTEKFHHLAAGELRPELPGLELVAVGYSGRVIVAERSGR